jgi:NitT/TauT family transport system ATP-binding protein
MPDVIQPSSQLSASHIYKSWGSHNIYHDFSITFPESKITSILGPSGCGKTTLLNILAGSLVPEHGELKDFLNRKISVIFQEPRLLPWMTVLNNLEFVLLDQFNEVKSRSIALEYLNMMGLSDYKYYFPAQLSGGMKQRVAMARAFAFPSDIILMDEPFRALDVKLKDNLIIEFLKLWEKDRRTVIFVTHDIGEALRLGSLLYIFSKPEVKLAGTFQNDEMSDKAELNRKIIELL